MLPTLRARFGAAVGIVGLVGYWLAVPAASPPVLFFIWLAALAGWILAFAQRIRLRPPTWGTWLMLLLVGLGIIPRLLSLQTAPYHITLDEILDAYHGLQLLHDEPWALLSGQTPHFDHTYLLTMLQAWPALFLTPLLGARFASFVLGMGSLLATYALAHRLAGRTAALGATAMLTCSYWHMVSSRTAHTMMQPVLFVVLALYVSILGIDLRNRLLQFLGGVLLGLCLLVYVPARIAVPLFAVWFLHSLLTRRLHWRDALPSAAAMLLGAAVMLTPYLQRHGIADMLRHFYRSSMSGSGPLAQVEEKGSSLAAVWEVFKPQLHEALKIYIQPGGAFAPHDYSRRPIIDPVSLGLALLGLGLATKRLRDPGQCLLLVWVVLTIVVAQVFTDLPIAAHRAAPILPAVAICAGQAFAALVHLAPLPWRRRVAGIALAALVAVIAPLNLEYLFDFLSWRADDPLSDPARFVAAGSNAPVYYVVSNFAAMTEHPVFSFIAYGRTLRDLPSLSDALGKTIDPDRDAVFVLNNWMTAAADTIRHCYPAATLQHQSTGTALDPLLALYVPRDAVRAGQRCATGRSAIGLTARYFRGDAWDGALVESRVEEWPNRFLQNLDAYHSLELAGSIFVPVPGTHQFQLLADDEGAQATVGASLQVQARQTQEVQLEPGWYSIRIRCKLPEAEASCWLRWAPPGGELRAIPSPFLRPQ